MVKFINRFTGNEMWVADDRVKEYEAAGHKLAASTFKLVKKQPAKKQTKKKR